jgi:hypothetical protein
MRAFSYLAAAMIVSLAAAPVVAELTPEARYSPYYTHTSDDSIVSFDWDASGNLYYQTSTPSFLFGGIFKYDGSNTTQPVAADTDYFAGASVVAIGDYVYYNNSDWSNNQYIYKYGPLSGTPAASQVSDTVNYSLHPRNGDMFISGGTMAETYLYHSGLDANGDLDPDPATTIGTMNGNSGPAAFDTAGNLYYAPGYGDLSIYRWTATEVAAAIADPDNDPLDPTGHDWLDYSGDFSVSGATSMLVNGDELLVTLTDFMNPSNLVSFDIDAAGAYAGTNTVVVEDTGRMGELRLHDGQLYLASDNRIVRVVPEPATMALLGLGGLAVLCRRRCRK